MGFYIHSTVVIIFSVVLLGVVIAWVDNGPIQLDPFSRFSTNRDYIRNTVNNVLSPQGPHPQLFVDDYQHQHPRIPGRPGVMPRLDNRNGFDEDFFRPRPRCDRKIRVINGATRIRERGSMVRFQCSYGYVMYGSAVAVCLRDKWSEPPPLCVRLGCRSIMVPLNTQARTSYGGAVVAFYCENGYEMEGESLMYCDGVSWNGTEPKCNAPSTTPTTTVHSTGETSTLNTETQTATTPTELSPEVSIRESSVPHSNFDLDWWDKSDGNLRKTSSYALETEASSSKTEFTAKGSSKIGDQDIRTTISTQAEHFLEKAITSVLPVRFHRHEFSTPIHATMTEMTKVKMWTTLKDEQDTSTTSPTDFDFNRETNELTNNSKSTKLNVSTQQPRASATAQVVRTGFATTPTTSITTFRLTPIMHRVTIKVNPTRWTTTRRPSGRRDPFRSIAAVTSRYPKRTRRPTITTTITTRKPKLSTVTVKRLTRSTTSTLPITTAFIPGIPFLNDTISIPDNDNDDNDKPPEIISLQPSPHLIPDESSSWTVTVSHIATIVGLMVLVLLAVTVSVGILMYCWKQNKGIARARSYDLDGRMLASHSHDANEDFMWLQNREDGL